MNLLQKLRRLDFKRGRFARPQKAVVRLAFNQLLRLAAFTGLLAFTAAAILALRGDLPLPAGWMFAALAVLALTGAPILLLRWLTPTVSAFMLQTRARLRRAGEAGALEHRWVDMEDIHPFLPLAAIGIEDPDFPVHTGFAVRRMMRTMLENRRRKTRRGESTITQQLAKNLFLWPARTYTRKLVEGYLTVLMELLLPKRRILELYLNFVQLDRDLFGAAAAARRFFDKAAADLSAVEAARLVAVLPNPAGYRVLDPSPEVLRRHGLTLMRMEELGLPYLDLLEGQWLGFVRWAVKDYLFSLKPTDPWRSLDAPVNSAPGARDSFLYRAVINQFRVAENPRYRQGRQGWGETYCNIFVWDVTRAMGVEIPHRVDDEGNPAPDGMGRELDANALIEWLETCGQAFGWDRIGEREAQTLANRGHPVIACWKNPGGIGHAAVVRPGDWSGSEGPTIAQSGAENFNVGTVEQGFKRKAAGRNVVFYWHS